MDEKFLMEKLWQVVLADDHVDDLKRHDAAAGLIYVTDADSARAGSAKTDSFPIGVVG